VHPRLSQVVRSAPLGAPSSELQEYNAPRPGLRMSLRLCPPPAKRLRTGASERQPAGWLPGCPPDMISREGLPLS
jgi:hypothetical protein